MTMWVKISTAGTSVVCSACIAVAAALPAIDTAADHLAKSTSAGVQLSALANLGNLASLSAVPAYANFLQTGKVDALTPLASLSAVPAYADFLQTGDVHKLAPLASLSAVPAYADLVTGNSATKVAALRSLRSLSAIPEYLGLPVPDPASAQVTTLNAPSGGGTDPKVVKTTEPTGNKSNGSYSASFSPTIIPIFGSGGGKNSPDNGMRGYGAIANGLRAAIGLGPDPSTQGAP